MSYQVRFTRAAREDLRRLYAYLLERDLASARVARDKIGKGIELLKDFPFTCRKAAPDNALLRELVIPFGSSGYVVPFRIDDAHTVTIAAIRHQREDDYH